MQRIAHFLALLFSKTSDNLFIQLFRYGIVGGLSFIFDFGALYFFTEFVGVPYLASACIGFTFGLIMNFVLSVWWVFKSSESRRSRLTEFLGWVLIGVAGLGLNALIMWSFTDVFGFYYLVSKVISTIIVFAWNFFARRFLISKI